jgi:hypothetical protein
MEYPRRYFNAFLCMENRPRAVNIQRRHAAEDKEVLMCTMMEVSYLGATGRNPLLNDADLVTFEQMPAVAVTTPSIMLRVCSTHHLCHYLRPCRKTFSRLAIPDQHGMLQGDISTRRGTDGDDRNCALGVATVTTH